MCGTFLQRTYSLQDLSKSDLTQKGIHSSVHPLIQSVQQVPIAVVASHLVYFLGLFCELHDPHDILLLLLNQCRLHTSRSQFDLCTLQFWLPLLCLKLFIRSHFRTVNCTVGIHFLRLRFHYSEQMFCGLQPLTYTLCSLLNEYMFLLAYHD